MGVDGLRRRALEKQEAELNAERDELEHTQDEDEAKKERARAAAERMARLPTFARQYFERRKQELLAKGKEAQWSDTLLNVDVFVYSMLTSF